MTMVSLGPHGMLWPRVFNLLNPTNTVGGYSTFSASTTMDASGESLAFIGQVFWEDEPTSAKTMGSSSKIHWRSGSITFANAGTTFSVGLQDVSTSAGPPVRPDGTFDVRRNLVGGTDTIAATSHITTTLSTSGSKSVAQGDLIAVVFEMVSRGGTDSVVATYGMGPGLAAGQDRQNSPTAVSFVGGSWTVNTIAAVPNVLLEADDGTLGILVGSYFLALGSAYSFNSSSSPDEYGLIFQVPFRCKVGAVRLTTGSTSATADFTVKLYSDPLGTPALITSKTRLGENFANQTDDRAWHVMFDSQYELLPNTDYCAAVEATGAGSLDIGYLSVFDATHRAPNGMANCRRGSRTNGSGAFSETTTEIPAICPIITSIDNGMGAGRATLILGI